MQKNRSNLVILIIVAWVSIVAISATAGNTSIIYIYRIGIFDNLMKDNQTVPEVDLGMPPELLEKQVSDSCSNSFKNGISLLRDNKYEEALILFNQAIGLCPQNTNIWYNMGYANYQLGRFEKALDYFNKSISIDPYNKDSRIFIELSLQKLGKNDSNCSL